MHQLQSDIFVLFMDDKAKIPVGEPGEPVSTGVRGRHSIAPSTTELIALDHDMTGKGSISSTVFMEPNAPHHAEGSWYSGRVRVIVQDSVFKKSTAYRNAAASVRLAKEDPAGCKPIHIKYSDGGTEHRTLLIKVQLSLIAVFKMLGLDMLIACRPAPGQSWQNPVERVMAVLNIGLQNCALERVKMSEDIEGLLKRCGSMADIRKAAEKNPGLVQAWSTSIAPVHSGRALQSAQAEGRANHNFGSGCRQRGKFCHGGHNSTLPRDQSCHGDKTTGGKGCSLLFMGSKALPATPVSVSGRVYFFLCFADYHEVKSNVV